MTDLCDYCERALKLKKQISEIVRDENYPTQSNLDIELMIDFFKNKIIDIKSNLNQENQTVPENEDYLKYKTIIEILQDYEALLFHKNVAKCQREAYNNQRKNVDLLRNNILIEMDFMQKIMIGLSPRQVSSEYYKQKARSCLGEMYFFII